MLWTALGTVILCSALIKWACDSFEAASYHLGRYVFRMPPGVRGATLEAIGSSMPELLTTFFLLFFFKDAGGFSAGIATCAGSAVFNMVVIPALCILAVTVKSRVMPDPLPWVRLHRSTILRDGLFLLAAEAILILFLGRTSLTWWMGGLLLLIYLAYFSFLLLQIRRSSGGEEEESLALEQESAVENTPRKWVFRALTLDWNGLLFKGRAFSTFSAWTVLVLSVLSLSVVCHALAGAVIRSAEALAVPPYFTAVILGAAATSVPDTFISVANALKGDYDDAIANAVGSNIFDICVALGLPLMLYGCIHGAVQIEAGAGLTSSAVQPLRVALLGVTALVLVIFLTGVKKGNYRLIGRSRAYVLVVIYLIWNATIFLQGLFLA